VKRADVDGVQERGELLLLPFPSRFPYAIEAVGRACPARSPERAVLFRVSLGSPPLAPPAPPPAPPPVARLRSSASQQLMAGSDFSCPFIIGYGSSPSRRGPQRRQAARPDMRPLKGRRCLFARDGGFDLGGATASRIATPHVAPSTILNVSAPATLEISRLNSPPHAIVLYASQPPSPTPTQHSLPGVRYDLPGPDFHRLDSASLPDAQG
jgi:hypothetical protein